jgi:hypothetical protein
MTSYVAQLRQGTVDRLASVPVFRQVFDSRLPQLRRDMLPALRVYTTAAAAQGRSLNIPDFLTTTTLIVQLVAEDITDARSAEIVDTLCEAVKTRLLCDPSWLVLFERVSAIDTEIERNVEGESRTTIATITFSLQVSEYYEPVIPDRLEKIRIDIDVIRPAADPNIRYPGPDGRIEVSADFLRHPESPPMPAQKD